MELFLMWSCLVSMPRKKKDKVVTRLLPKKVRKKRSRGRPFEPGNPWRFPSGTSGNPGGRKRLIDAHVESLATIDIETGKTVAQLVSEKMCELAIAGDIVAARELRQATEGDTIHTPDVEKIYVSIDR